MLIGIACLFVFLVMALLMYSRRISALLALPVMAVLIAVIGGVEAKAILSEVVNDGILKLHVTYTTTMLGAILAELMNRHGIAKAMVRWVAEFSGDNPFLLGIVLTLVTAVLFSTLGGLGAVIMVGTIILPVMLSLGISNVTAGSLFLFGISLGGMFNLASWQLYMEVLGLQPEQIISFVVPFALVISIIILCFLGIELNFRKNVKYILRSVLVIGLVFFLLSLTSSQHISSSNKTPDGISIVMAALILLELIIYAVYRSWRNVQANPDYAFLTPLIPLVLVLLCHWDFIPAFMAGIIYSALATWKRGSVNILTRSIIDGITNVIPAVVLMMGIGMLINAVRSPAVTASIMPILSYIVPTKSISYILVFTALAPLALYRGPLSLWGMGSGLVALIQKATTLSSQAIMGMLMSVGQIQGICDPTNTHNIWIATYLGTDTQILLRKTIPYAWVGVLLGLSLAVSLGYVSF